MLSSMARGAGQDLVCNGTFHEAFGSVLIIAQCLAMLPVTGVKSSSAYSLKFSWRSYRTIYSVVAFGFAMLYTIFATCITLTKPVTFNSFGLYDAFDCKFCHCDNFILIILDYSAPGILLNHSIWCVEFYSFGTKMAKTNATLGVCRIGSATLHYKRTKGTAWSEDSDNIDHRSDGCSRYLGTNELSRFSSIRTIDF